jgi:hypothetical protein
LGSTQAAVPDGFFDDLADLGFYDWRMAAVDQINFIRNRINPKYLVPLGGKTSCGDGSNITQTKDADFQDALHFPSSRLLLINCSVRFLQPRSRSLRDSSRSALRLEIATASDFFRQIGLS